MSSTVKQRIGAASIAVVTGFVLASSCLAQDLNPRLTLTAGASNFNAARTFTAGGGAFRSQYAAGGDSSIRFTMDLDKPWAVEGSYGFGTNNLRVYDLNPNNVATGQRDFGTRVKQFTVNALYFVGEPTGHLRLFATAGLGIKRVSPTDAAKAAAATDQFITDRANISSSTSPELNLGFGGEAKMAKTWGVRFDIRDAFSGIPRFGLSQNPSGGDYYPVSGHVSHIESSIGVVYYIR
jgi:hypothetical protein